MASLHGWFLPFWYLSQYDWQLSLPAEDHDDHEADHGVQAPVRDDLQVAVQAQGVLDDEALGDDDQVESGRIAIRTILDNCIEIYILKKIIKKYMKKLLLWIWIIAFVGFYMSWKYNTMVMKDEVVITAMSQVENQYQRRMDLIPNLVETVKGFADHEQETLQWVVDARAKATQAKIDVNDAKSLSAFQASQWELSSALSRLMVVVENYPDIKANTNFLELQAQLEWTENRIAVERKNYNETVKAYNIYIRSFPNNFVANYFDFEKANQFESTEWSDQAPKVDFGW